MPVSSESVVPEPAGKTNLDPATFRRFCDYIYEQSGIVLREGKESLVMARIGKRMRATAIDTPREYLRHVLSDTTGRELIELLDAISTNLTFFFRESAHFDFLSKVLKEWYERGQLRYRLWCAAASTGEEPYSIAMTAVDAVGEGRVDMRILATDISTRVLTMARAGEYDEARLRNVPPAFRSRFFEAEKREGGRAYNVRSNLREMLHFRRLNLATPPFPMRGPLDIIFCRNVMIYFDRPVRARFLEEANRLLKPGGYLIVGHSESLTGTNHAFRAIQPAVYLKP